MAPRTRGEKYAWLDPSSAYINARAFHAMLDDLLESFSADDIDVVAGFDAAGFVLAAAMATPCAWFPADAASPLQLPGVRLPV